MSTTAHTPIQGESNATVMAQHLERISVLHTRISELTDQLAAARNELSTESASATEFAEQTGQSAQTRQALDAATAVTDQLGQHLGSVSDAATEAAEQTDTAREGLRPVEQAEDELLQAGADGRAVAAATAA